jgi:hypothetical protein
MENVGNTELILTPPVKAKAGLIMIIKVVKKYCYGTKVSSTKQSPGIRESLGRLPQSMPMEQSWFIMETN